MASYKEVAEHVGLLSGSSSEEEVEDITDFDQGDSLIKQPWIVEPIFIHLCPSRLAVHMGQLINWLIRGGGGLIDFDAKYS